MQKSKVHGRIRRLVNIAAMAGLDLRRLVDTSTRIPGFLAGLDEYKRSMGHTQTAFRSLHVYPVLGDASTPAGTGMGHYFHQDLWAARRIHQSRPPHHIDVGSRIDGFIAHLLTFMPVTVVDIRPLRSDVDGLTFLQADATDLSSFGDSSIESLSSLHAVEHIGLGRYGDRIDPDGCFKCMQALARVLAPRGRLLFGVPIGRERVEFNAHRVFSPDTVISRFGSYGLQLVSFSAVDDKGFIHPDALIADFHDAWYSCGLFEFTKPHAR